MRTITSHQAPGLNEKLTITVLDTTGAGGAPHHYHIRGDFPDGWDIHFQKGPVQEAGINGTSNEALLAIVRDRLECFQLGPYACEENDTALEGVLAAMAALHRRTKKRIERGVEGTSTP